MTRKRKASDVADSVNAICQMVALGKTLREIQAELGIPLGTMMDWVGMPEHSERYARAREAASDLFEADILTEAQGVTSENAAAARVRIDALKWVAARRSPKRYGDKLALGGDADLPPIQTVTRIELIALERDTS